MRKGVLFFVILLFSFSSIFADFQIETGLSEEEQRNIIEEINNLYGPIDTTIQGGYNKFIDKYFMNDINKSEFGDLLRKVEKLQENNNTERMIFILEYIKYLLKNDLYIAILINYKDSTYGPDVVNDIEKYLYFYDSNEENYLNLLDLLFASYDILLQIDFNLKSYDDLVNNYNEGMENLKVFGDNYDNYKYYLGRYSKYLGEYYDLTGDTNNSHKYLNIYENYKNLELFRKDNVKSSYIEVYFTCTANCY